ncbi:Crp/Fnr family transcriptional regulator [Endothiovibrio diazotrophicus]
MLENIALFNGMPTRELHILEGYTSRRRVDAGTVLFREGDESRYVYCILSGGVRVYLSSSQGREYTINTLGPGEYFGELALVDDTRRSASVETLDETLLMRLSQHDLERCMQEHAAVAINLFQRLAVRVRELTREVRGFALLSKRERLQQLLLELAEGQSGVRVVRNRPTHEQLAERIGASREMVTRLLRELERNGLIEKRGRSLLIQPALAEPFLDNF